MLNMPGGGGRSLMHEACLSGNVPSVRVLMASRAIKSWSMADDEGSTPLHLACAGGHVEVVEMLCDVAGAAAGSARIGGRPSGIGMTDSRGRTPAEIAAMRAVGGGERFAAVLEVLRMCESG